MCFQYLFLIIAIIAVGETPYSSDLIIFKIK